MPVETRWTSQERRRQTVRTFARSQDRPLDHFPNPGRSTAYESVDLPHLRQVAPVVDRHLGSHRRGPQPGGVEGPCVVGEPEVLQVVVGRSERAIRSGGERKRLAIPVGALVGREDRPAHGGESPYEERSGASYDSVSGLEPRDVTLSTCIGHCAEADKRGHPVGIPQHRSFHRMESRHIVIGRVVEQPALPRGQPPEYPVQHGPGRRLPVTGDGLPHPDEPDRHQRRPARLRVRFDDRGRCGLGRVG